MLSRNVLTTRVVNSLLKQEFEVLLTRGCFDIAAKRERLLLVKSMVNVDGLNSEIARDLRTASYFLSACPFVVSVRSNRGPMEDGMVYERFDLPVVTPKMFDDIIEGDAYPASSAKGRRSVEIDADSMREKRYELKFTLEELSDLVGVSKKALYEIENKRTNPTEQTVKMLERTLKIDLRKVYEPKVSGQSCSEPASIMQKVVSRELSRMGVENSPVCHSPFDVLGREKFSLMACVEKDMEKRAVSIKKLSGILSSSAFFVSKSGPKKVEGVPVIQEGDLPEIKTPKDLKKLIDENED